ncbi:MAG: hypothetical protein JJU12_01460 [Chlamydiales bacterium]|nr:hypothetical protein [Chlamydiales bacterium]
MRAFDFAPFVVKEKAYVVLYIKDTDVYSAVFFLLNDYFGERLLELINTHELVVTPNQF